MQSVKFEQDRDDMRPCSKGAQRVLLVGPAVGVTTAAYNAGMGGYVRNMRVYLDHFRPTGFQIVPCYNTVREKGEIPGLTLAVRFWRDISNFIRLAKEVDIVHILAQYRRAFPREAMMSAICQFFRRPFIYEIKAGEFARWYSSSPSFLRKTCSSVIRRAAAVLCEGRSMKRFVEETFSRPAIYVPNFVPEAEIPEEIPALFGDDNLRVVYVGYCYRGKGVFQLLDAVAQCAEQRIPIRLTLGGQDHPEFAAYADKRLEANPDLKVQRLGLLEHDKALDCIKQNDVFCLASAHPGEGHSNVLNEAMMLGRVIVATRHGFLGEILDESCAYFVEKHSVDSLVAAFRHIYYDRDKAREKAMAARQRLLNNFTSKQTFPVIEECYRAALAQVRASSQKLFGSNT